MSESNFSARIRELRAKHGLTLEQVAQQVGVGRSTVRKWETGIIENMRRDKISKLAAALHTTPGYLMGWSEEPEATLTISHIIPKDADRIPTDNIIKLAGRDGSFRERRLSDEQMAALKAILDQMPDVPDDL